MVVKVSVNITKEQTLHLHDLASKGELSFQEKIVKSEFQHNAFILLNLLFEAYKTSEEFEKGTFSNSDHVENSISKVVNLKVRNIFNFEFFLIQ